MNIIDIKDLLLKSKKNCFDVYTLDQFIGYSDIFGTSSITVHLEPFIIDDDWLAGWYMAFINEETGRYCVVAEDDAESQRDFTLLHKSLKDYLSIIMGMGIEKVIINTSGKHENNAVDLDKLDVPYIFKEPDFTYKPTK